MTRADATAELLDRTGVDIRAARFYEPSAGALDWQGNPKKACWYLSVVGPLPGADRRLMPHGVSAGSSRTFREPRSLNALLWKLGRDESLPRLTANDGRRILALLRVVAGVEGSS